MFTSLSHAQTLEDTFKFERQALVNWIMKNSHDKINLIRARKILDNAYLYANKNFIDPLVVLSIMKTESGFRDKVTSSYGAKGILQVVPRFHQDKLKGRNPYDLIVSLEVGTQVLKDCMDKYQGNLYKTSNCYSGGGGKKYYNHVVMNRKDIIRSVILSQFEAEEPLSNF
jgi:soluble lytic murein transglycosylase-like protein